MRIPCVSVDKKERRVSLAPGVIPGTSSGVRRVGKDLGGQVFQETFSGLKGWKKRFFFLDRRAIPDAMAWRHYDSDVNDPVLEDGFHASDVKLLFERVVDLRPVPSGLLFHGGLATTWDFSGFRPVFKDTEGNGPSLTSQDRIEQHTTRPLSSDQPIPKKMDHQKEVEVEDPKIVAIRERKAKVTAKRKKKKKRHGDDGGEGSRPKTKRKKTVARKVGPATFEATSSPEPIRIVNPNQANPSNVDAATAESREQHSPRDSVGHSVHNYSGNIDEGESSRGRAFYVPDWSIHQRCRLDTPEWCRELMVHLAPPAAQEESNALNYATAFGSLWPGEPWLKLTFLKDSNNFKLALTSWPKRMPDVRIRKFKNDHVDCLNRIRLMEDQNNELSQVNNEQSLRIKELKGLLAKKDFALVYAERINSERA
ncbi:hypothetical protein Tco_0216791 [Tanacetum coccineum]